MSLPVPVVSSRTNCSAHRLAGALAVLLTSAPALADYPIASHRYLADPGSVVHEGRVYLYNSNDDDNAVEGGYSMHSIVCISTSDMKNWTDHGIVFEVPGDASWANNSWAPQPIVRDGVIYLYFGNSASGVGVASSADPTGGFEDARGSYLVNSSTPGASGTDSWLFDPGALIDEDGAAYLSFGGNGETNARIIALGGDLTSVSGSAAQLAPPDFFEASFLFKRNDIYYLAYSTNPDNGMRIDYMTSDSPMSGYTYRGVIGDQPPQNNNNNHASEFEFNGQWYHAYHNRIVSTQAGISTTYKRNLALEVLNFEADGAIREVTYTTDGVPQVGHLDPYARVEAETTNAQSGIETEPCDAGGMNVTEISNGDWIRVRGADFGSPGAEQFQASVASNADGGAIEVHLDEEDGMLAATCAVPNTGGPQAWQMTTCAATGATGVKDLYLKFTGASFNVDFWQFTGSGGGAGGAGGQGGAGAGPVAGAMSGGGAMAGGGAGNGGTASPAGGSGIAGTQATGGVMSAGGAGAGGVATAGGAMNAGSGGAPLGGAGVRGSPSSGGTSAGGPSSGGMSGGGAGADATASDDGGCGCRVGGSSRSSRLPLAACALFAFSWVRRRRPQRVGRSTVQS